MFRPAVLAGSVAILAVLLVAATVWGIGGVGTPARTSQGGTSVPIMPEDVDETFYVVAYHWGWAIFTEDGTDLDAIRVGAGNTVEIFAVNALADVAIDKLPAPVSEAITSKGLTITSQGITNAQAAEAEPLWPEMEDHGFLIPSHGVTEYLGDDAQDLTRVVFKAGKPGEYEFVCTNYCGMGHIFMSQPMLIAE